MGSGLVPLSPELLAWLRPLPVLDLSLGLKVLALSFPGAVYFRF